VVLLPGTAIPLHIFEPRYRRMVARCRQESIPFGLIYHDPDLHGPFLSEAGRVGTEAHIEVCDSLPDGRSLILVRGGERFHIRAEGPTSEPYYQATVERFGDRDPEVLEAKLLREHRRRSIALLTKAVEALGGDPGELPAVDPEGEVSFQLARCLQIDASWLQALLELREESQRLRRLDAVFRAAVRARGQEQ
jgi:Lon protease-like protein